MGWIRAGQAGKDPTPGDTIQVVPGAEYVDPQGAGAYREGDVGKVTSCESSVDASGVRAITVAWSRTGKTSVIPGESLSCIRCFRMQEPRVGDLMVAVPGGTHTDSNDVEHYVGGDSGSVV